MHIEMGYRLLEYLFQVAGRRGKWKSLQGRVCRRPSFLSKQIFGNNLYMKINLDVETPSSNLLEIFAGLLE